MTISILYLLRVIVKHKTIYSKAFCAQVFVFSFRFFWTALIKIQFLKLVNVIVYFFEITLLICMFIIVFALTTRPNWFYRTVVVCAINFLQKKKNQLARKNDHNGTLHIYQSLTEIMSLRICAKASNTH